jgi:hypothetical protein
MKPRNIPESGMFRGFFVLKIKGRNISMSKTVRKPNVRNVNKWRGYYMEDMECRYCKFFQGKKRGCSRDKCCCEDEKLEAMAKGRIKRKRGSMTWDM